jgi:cell wall-associated NlpC family hydrolase
MGFFGLPPASLLVKGVSIIESLDFGSNEVVCVLRHMLWWTNNLIRNTFNTQRPSTNCQGKVGRQMKKLFIISAITLVTTSSTVAFAEAITDTDILVSNKVISGQVTELAPIINSLVQKEIVVSGPVQTQVIQAGPIFSSDAPLVGSIDWMAQEKAEKDKLKSDAERKQAALEAEAARVQAELEAEIARLEEIAENTKTLNETLVLVKNQIGITPWVFGGSTTKSWDCSGMVRWAYAHLGIDLEHRASIQRHSGEFVTEPKIGDLVSFNHENYGSAYHIGIYVGPDQMLHAGGKPGDRTEIRSIKGWAKDNGGSEITYTRIIETNN